LRAATVRRDACQRPNLNVLCEKKKEKNIENDIKEKTKVRKKEGTRQ
jgi:hypothetical protein